MVFHRSNPASTSGQYGFATVRVWRMGCRITAYMPASSAGGDSSRLPFAPPALLPWPTSAPKCPSQRRIIKGLGAAWSAGKCFGTGRSDGTKVSRGSLYLAKRVRKDIYQCRRLVRSDQICLEGKNDYSIEVEVPSCNQGAFQGWRATSP